jgi:hypothetical protein
MFLKTGKALCQLGNESSQRGDSAQWGGAKRPTMLAIVCGGVVLIGSISKIRVPDKVISMPDHSGREQSLQLPFWVAQVLQETL